MMDINARKSAKDPQGVDLKFRSELGTRGTYALPENSSVVTILHERFPNDDELPIGRRRRTRIAPKSRRVGVDLELGSVRDTVTVVYSCERSIIASVSLPVPDHSKRPAR